MPRYRKKSRRCPTVTRIMEKFSVRRRREPTKIRSSTRTYYCPTKMSRRRPSDLSCNLSSTSKSTSA